MIPTKPYHVVALHRRERSIWCNGGYDSDVTDIVRGEMGTRERTAEADQMYQAFTQGRLW